MVEAMIEIGDLPSLLIVLATAPFWLFICSFLENMRSSKRKKPMTKRISKKWAKRGGRKRGYDSDLVLHHWRPGKYKFWIWGQGPA